MDKDWLDKVVKAATIYNDQRLHTNFQEEEILNNCLKNNRHIKIVIYRENCTDNKVILKYNQLYKLGFANLYVYIGGLFEWLLLQDIYGFNSFPTTTKENDLLKYKGRRIFNVKVIEHYM